MAVLKLSRLGLDGLNGLPQHLSVGLGVLHLQLSQLQHALLAVSYSPLLLHFQLRLGCLGHLLECSASLLLPREKTVRNTQTQTIVFSVSYLFSA